MDKAATSLQLFPPDDTWRTDTLDFIASLPVALERGDVRVCHACWHAPSFEKLRQFEGNVLDAFRLCIRMYACMHIFVCVCWQAPYIEKLRRFEGNVLDAFRLCICMYACIYMFVCVTLVGLPHLSRSYGDLREMCWMHSGCVFFCTCACMPVCT